MSMVRDNIKDELYFNEFICKTENSINKFEGLISKVIKEKGIEDVGVKNGYNILVSSYFIDINLLYSVGADIAKMKEKFLKLITYYNKMWTPEYGYIELIRVLSLSCLFEVDYKDMAELEEKIISEKFDDYLVNILLRHIDNSWKLNSNDFIFTGIYDELKTIIENQGSDFSRELKRYLETCWYSNHKDAPWYESHKSKQNIYYGYWSFEAGAIAKILNIDDSSLKDTPYYPYDLVHYK